MKNLHFIALFLLALGLNSCDKKLKLSEDAPNILFIIADDWSYPHAGVYGDAVVKTPHFDRIANEGLLFTNAYVSSPSCTPSRAAVLTGQHFWRLGVGANLYGPLPLENLVYTNILEEAGFLVGHSEKGWGPGQAEGRTYNPAGKQFDSFADFLTEKSEAQPFCFWFGSFNPHRGYKKDSGAEAGIDPAKIQLPGCFPDHETVRRDMADYYKEVQDLDDQIGALLAQLDSINALDNTIIVVTSDNGMPFPRCKSNVYDMGTRVPLAIRWASVIKTPAVIDDFVSLTDLAPTFLEVAGQSVPKKMTGKSLHPYFNGKTSENRKQVFFGKERHVPGQESGNWGGYPSRAIRTHDFLYVKNFKPDRWPAGTPDYQKASFFPSYYADVDGGPTRTYMFENKERDENHSRLFELAFGMRPAEELYDLKNDPNQLNNVADDNQYTEVKAELQRQLMKELKQTKDPRVLGGDEVFEQANYTGGSPFPDNFRRMGRNYATVRIDSFPSKFVDPRPVEVLVPVNIHHDETFPVLYMFDGQNIFHSFRGWGGEENKGWRVTSVLDSLNEVGTVPKMIVVGIFNNQEKRGAEYMPAKPKDLLQQRIAETDHEWYKSFQTSPPESDEQLKFIVEELKPYIDANFKTKPDQANTFVAGASMGGLISAYAICEYPEVIGGAACFSTHWPPLDGVFLEYIKENLPDPANHKIYFDHGTEGLDAEYEPFQQIADAAMLARGYEKGKNWITLKAEGAKHHEDDWHARLHIPLEFLLKGK